jgi:predicted transcriptional regulator
MAEPVRDKISDDNLLRLTTDVVAAYVSNNPLPTGQLSVIIATVYESLSTLNHDPAQAAPVEELKPAVPIRKSVTDEYLICLEDGKKLKMLKRHLRSTYNMSPDDYRTKWNLPLDYPMVAPDYAKQRSAFAKQIGLGRTAGRGNGKDKK